MRSIFIERMPPSTAAAGMHDSDVLLARRRSIAGCWPPPLDAMLRAMIFPPRLFMGALDFKMSALVNAYTLPPRNTAYFAMARARFHCLATTTVSGAFTKKLGFSMWALFTRYRLRHMMTRADHHFTMALAA